MSEIKRRSLLVALAGVGVAGAFYAGVAYAADPRLDDADALVEKAILVLEAAENPGPKIPFGGHRNKAVHDLKQARAQIAKAKAYADNPKNQPKKPKSE
ncbi:MAG: hypothetical protein IPI67_32660 [Myxococcales bacterium]|nr:hypothetical protein [Myxococcales bacterium]